jgi:hypothetical protein
MRSNYSRRLACSPSALGIIAAALALTTVAVAGCETPGDVADTVSPVQVGNDHGSSDKPSCGQTSPCAAIFCGPDRHCVVVDTQPPTAICEVITQPAGCHSTSDCPADTICKSVPGVCGRNPSCDATGFCDTSCWATCVAQPQPQPARCVTNHDCAPSQQCSTARGECLGCDAPAGVACLPVCYGLCESIPNGV